MNCERCGGLFLPEKYYGISGSWEGAHCIKCGNVVDPIILLNRAGIPLPDEGVSDELKGSDFGKIYREFPCSYCGEQVKGMFHPKSTLHPECRIPNQQKHDRKKAEHYRNMTPDQKKLMLIGKSKARFEREASLSMGGDGM